MRKLSEDGTLAFASRFQEELKQLTEHNDRVYRDGRRPPTVKFMDGSYIHSRPSRDEDIPNAEAAE